METATKLTKDFLYAQFQPVKTLRQLVEDRNGFRAALNLMLLVVLFL